MTRGITFFGSSADGGVTSLSFANGDTIAPDTTFARIESDVAAGLPLDADSNPRHEVAVAAPTAASQHIRVRRYGALGVRLTGVFQAGTETDTAVDLTVDGAGVDLWPLADLSGWDAVLDIVVEPPDTVISYATRAIAAAAVPDLADGELFAVDGLIYRKDTSVLFALSALKDVGRGQVLAVDPVDLRHFGADTSAADNAEAIELALRVAKSVRVVGIYSVSTPLTLTALQARSVLRGQNAYQDGILLTDVNAVITLDNCNRPTFENLSVDGGYVANRCVAVIANTQEPRFVGCHIHSAREQNMFFDEHTTEFSILGSLIEDAGARTATTVESVGHAIVCAGNGRITDTVLGGNTGTCLTVIGNVATEEVRIQMVGGRCNFSADSPLVIVDGYSHSALTTLVMTSVYIENPGNIGGMSVSFNPEAALLAKGPGARITLDSPTKLHVRKAASALKAVDGGKIHFVANGCSAVAQNNGSAAISALIETGTDTTTEPGQVVMLGAPSIQRIGESQAVAHEQWDVFERRDVSQPFVDQTSYPASKPCINIWSDGRANPVAGNTSTALSVERGVGLGPDGALRIDMLDAEAKPIFVDFPFVIPAACVGKYIQIVAVVRYTQSGAVITGSSGDPRIRMRFENDAAVWPASADTGLIDVPELGDGNSTEWFPLSLVCFANTAGATNIRLYADWRTQTTLHTMHVSSIIGMEISGEYAGTPLGVGPLRVDCTGDTLDTAAFEATLTTAAGSVVGTRVTAFGYTAPSGEVVKTEYDYELSTMTDASTAWVRV